MPDKNIAMTVREAANELGVSVQYIYQLMREGQGKEAKLERWEPPVRGDRTIYVTIASVERFKREREAESPVGGSQMSNTTGKITWHVPVQWQVNPFDENWDDQARIGRLPDSVMTYETAGGDQGVTVKKFGKWQ